MRHLIIVGGTLEESGAHFIETWKRLEAGETVEPTKTVSASTLAAAHRLIADDLRRSGIPEDRITAEIARWEIEYR